MGGHERSHVSTLVGGCGCVGGEWGARWVVTSAATSAPYKSGGGGGKGGGGGHIITLVG